MLITTADPWTIMPQVCFLCAHELTPHEAETRREGQSFGMCSACAKLARRVGKSKIYLVISKGEFSGGMFAKADFVESLKLTIHTVVRNKTDNSVVKIFDTPSEARTWYDARIISEFDYQGKYKVSDEQAHTWPIGMKVEIWDRYHYVGTFVVVEGSRAKRHLQEIEADPRGTSAHIHNDFPESEPKYRYRRLLDPNWQMKLPARIAQWRKVGRVGEQGYSIGNWVRGMAISAEVYAFHRREHAQSS